MTTTDDSKLLLGNDNLASELKRVSIDIRKDRWESSHGITAIQLLTKHYNKFFIEYQSYSKHHRTILKSLLWRYKWTQGETNCFFQFLTHLTSRHCVQLHHNDVTFPNVCILHGAQLTAVTSQCYVQLPHNDVTIPVVRIWHNAQLTAVTSRCCVQFPYADVM